MKTDVASYVPRTQFSDEEIRSQVGHCEKHGWAMIIEFTHDPSRGDLPLMAWRSFATVVESL